MKSGKNFIGRRCSFYENDVKDNVRTGWYTDVIEAADGAQAVEMYQAEKPDLVFMDITMPNKDGLEALKEIKALDPAATVVMCSAMGQEAMVMDSIKSGAKDFIVKPFKPERILSTIKKILG